MKYRNPPIIEAIIDIQTQTASAIEASKLDDLALPTKLKDQYSLKDKIVSTSTSVTMPNIIISQNNDYLGVKFISTNKRYIAQFKKTGFTFSEVNGYEDWTTFQARIKELWDVYQSNFNLSNITRIGLRYINKINIPFVKFDLAEYFETYPRIFSENKGDMSGFFLQAQIPQSEDNVAILNQTITNPSEPGHTSILLDIDVFNPHHIQPNNDEELWKSVELLRKQKNDLFENSITQKTRGLFL